MARLTDRPQRETPPPPGSPFLPPAPGPQLPPAEPRVRQRAAAALTLALLSLIAMLLIRTDQRAVYVAAVALVVALTALVLAFSAMSAARRAKTRRPGGALAGVVLGVLGLGFSGLAMLGFLIFGTQLNQYSRCMNLANTVAEQQACRTQLDNSVGTQIGIIGNR